MTEKTALYLLLFATEKSFMFVLLNLWILWSLERNLPLWQKGLLSPNKRLDHEKVKVLDFIEMQLLTFSGFYNLLYFITYCRPDLKMFSCLFDIRWQNILKLGQYSWSTEQPPATTPAPNKLNGGSSSGK